MTSPSADEPRGAQLCHHVHTLVLESEGEAVQLQW